MSRAIVKQANPTLLCWSLLSARGRSRNAETPCRGSFFEQFLKRPILDQEVANTSSVSSAAPSVAEALLERTRRQSYAQRTSSGGLCLRGLLSTTVQRLPLRNNSYDACGRGTAPGARRLLTHALAYCRGVDGEINATRYSFSLADSGAFICIDVQL